MQLKELKAFVSSKVQLTVLISGSSENGWYMAFWGSAGLDDNSPRFEFETARGDWKKYKSVDSCLSDLRKVGIDISNPMSCKLLLNPIA